MVSIVVSKKTEQNKEVEEMNQDLKQKFIDKFAAGTLIGEKGMQIVSLSLIYSDDLGGGYNE